MKWQKTKEEVRSMQLKSVERRNQKIEMTADGFHFFVTWNEIRVPFEDYVEADIYFEQLVGSMPVYEHQS